MNPQNGIIGDVSATELPTNEIEEAILLEEKSMARYSQSKEFKRLKEYIDSRIEFYQTCLPDGRPVAAVPTKELESQWIIANTVIAEFKGILSDYEKAREIVKNG